MLPSTAFTSHRPSPCNTHVPPSFNRITPRPRQTQPLQPTPSQTAPETRLCADGYAPLRLATATLPKRNGREMFNPHNGAQRNTRYCTGNHHLAQTAIDETCV